MSHSRINHFLVLSGIVLALATMYCFRPFSAEVTYDDYLPERAELIVARPIQNSLQAESAMPEEMANQVVFDGEEQVASEAADQQLEDPNQFGMTLEGESDSDTYSFDAPEQLTESFEIASSETLPIIADVNMQAPAIAQPQMGEPAAQAELASSKKLMGWKSNPYIQKSNQVSANASASSSPTEMETAQQPPNPSVLSHEWEIVEPATPMLEPGQPHTPKTVAGRPMERATGMATRKTQPATQTAAQSELNNNFVPPRGVDRGIVPADFQIPESVSIKAAHHIEYGKSLARRNATFAARQEFFAGLRLVAQAIDNQTGGVHYTETLSNAVNALKEAEDFHIRDSENQLQLSVANVIDGHQTKILSPKMAETMTPIQAMQAYFAYAQDQFIQSGGQTIVAAEAHYCLGKMHSVMAKKDRGVDPLDIAKSMVYHQASLTTDQNNFRSANELGVLLARNGQLEQAKELFKTSLRIKQLPHAWKSLAIIHQRLSEPQLASLAQTEMAMTMQRQMIGTSGDIQWYNPQQFNELAPPVWETKTEMLARQPELPTTIEPQDETPGFFSRLIKRR